MLSHIVSSEGSNGRERNVLLYTKKLAFTGLVKAQLLGGFFFFFFFFTHIATGEGPKVCPAEPKL
jgi:hypothetical protein